MERKRNPTQRQIESLESIIGRLEDWQHRFHEHYNEVESGKRELMQAVNRLEQRRQGAT